MSGSEPRPQLTALDISDPPERWRALGFHVDERDVAHVGGIDVHLGAPGDGITQWGIAHIPDDTTTLDGLPTTAAPAPTPPFPQREHPNPVDGTWSFQAEGAGTRVHFAADGQLRGAMRLLEPVTRRLMARQFAGYHRNLRRNVEGG